MKKRKSQSRQPAKVLPIATDTADLRDGSPGAPEPRKHEPASDIFERLEKRGIGYDQVKRIVQFERPHDTLFFAQWFKGRKISRVLKQTNKWKKLLKEDFVLCLSPDLKLKVEEFILQTELMVWRALIEANPQIGPWDLQIRIRPNDRDESGHPVQPNQEIIVINSETKEKKSVEIPGGKLSHIASRAEALKQAFEKLELWDQMWKGDPSQDLISNRSQQGWPIFTQIIIPRLYQFMAPHYKEPGHYSAKIDGTAAEAKRPARVPKALLLDVLEILKMEHDYAFKDTTVDQLKADVQRYLAQKRRSRSSKLPLELSRQKPSKPST